jgi:hypothetical protein
LIRGYIEAMGRDKALEVVESVIKSISAEAGRQLAVTYPDRSLESFTNQLLVWNQGGALEYEITESSPTRFCMNVTRCKYAEMYKRLGVDDLGYSFSCIRDFSMVEAFNPEIKLTRTQTIMEGADYCDFVFEQSNRE